MERCSKIGEIVVTRPDLIILTDDVYGTFVDGFRSVYLNDLASKKGVVLMYGPGFEAPEGFVLISLANLNEDDYVEIARRLNELLGEYHQQYEGKTALPAAA